MMFIDISVQNFSGAFTKNAKQFGVSTGIVLKIPRAHLTTVRLTGTLFQLTEFLRSLTLSLSSTWTESTVRMHLKAVKPVGAPLIQLKNRALIENRKGSNS